MPGCKKELGICGREIWTPEPLKVMKAGNRLLGPWTGGGTGIQAAWVHEQI